MNPLLREDVASIEQLVENAKRDAVDYLHGLQSVALRAACAFARQGLQVMSRWRVLSGASHSGLMSDITPMRASRAQSMTP